MRLFQFSIARIRELLWVRSGVLRRSFWFIRSRRRIPFLNQKQNPGSNYGDYTRLALRVLPLGEPSRTMMLNGSSGRVKLDPHWYDAGLGFVALGVQHILTGFDHLLFLLCLVIPFRRIKGLIRVVTAFTVGHSVTLIGTAFGLAPTRNGSHRSLKWRSPCPSFTWL